MVKKFKVTNAFRSAAQIAGTEPYDGARDNYVGDFCEAETAAEAIEIAIDFLCDQIIQNGFTPERTAGSVAAVDLDGNKAEEYYAFMVTEAEQ